MVKKKIRTFLNQLQGKLGEISYLGEKSITHQVIRKGRGQDFIVRKKNDLGKPVGRRIRAEVKTGNSQLSPLQRKTQRKHKGSYKVVRSIWRI